MRVEVENDEIFDIKEAAKFCKVSPNTIRLWIKEGVIDYWRTSANGPYRFFKSEIIDGLKNNPKRRRYGN